MTRKFLSVLGVATLVSVNACGSNTDQGNENESTASIELFSWWVEGGERDALRALLEVHEAKHPEVEVVNVVGNNADNAREQLEEQMAEGQPPATFQANIGENLLGWVENEEFESTILPIDDLAEEQGWFDVFPEKLLKAASRDGKLYGVPLNVHRLNSLFYNKRLFDEYGWDVPETVEELNRLVVQILEHEELQASKKGGVAPLALGNRYDWTLSLLTFEAILPSLAGPEYYERFWSGKGSPNDPEMRAALEEVLFLYCGPNPEKECSGYFNKDNGDLTWSEAVALLATGSAAMTVMGDWAKGYLENQSLVADEDFGVVPFPGSSGTFVYTADTFPLTDGAHTEGTRDLLVTFGSIEGQMAFNSIKGSIPARTDFDLGDYPDEFDAVSRRTQKDFREGYQLLATSGLVPENTFGDLPAELKASLNASTIEGVVEYLQDEYDALE